eukprot:m.30005 g.30005  ORF g.30005 m.30005 type:complete len:114 (-) comp8162_c0_seq1:52-393(-)
MALIYVLQLLPSHTTNKKPWKSASCYTLDFYKRFFDVDTEQVLFRIRSSCWPIHNKFLSQIQGKGDLYGPIWIGTTLIFVVAMVGNIVDWKDSFERNEQDAWKYDFNKGFYCT